jgi:DNA-binding NarL/FixJ family response regulator
MRVVIGEDHALMREGLALVLERAGSEVVGVASDGEDLVRKARAHDPDLVLADIRLPPDHTDEGLRAALTIRRNRPAIAIAVLSHHVQRSYARELVQSAAGGGGVGYLLKQRVADARTFCSDLRRIGAGATVLDPEVATALLERARHDDPLERLTRRQRRVLELMAEGASNASIAERLVISEKAVIKHVSQIYAALGLRPDAGRHRRVVAVSRYRTRGTPA